MRAAAFLLLALAAAPAAAQEASRTLAVEISEDGRVIGTPTLSVRPGRPAAVSVGGVYSLRVRVDAVEGGYMVRSSLYRPGADNGWTLVGSPAVQVAEGGEARVRLDQAAQPAITFAVSLR